MAGGSPEHTLQGGTASRLSGQEAEVWMGKKVHPRYLLTQGPASPDCVCSATMLSLVEIETIFRD